MKNKLQITGEAPLLYFPELTNIDIQNSTLISVDDKEVLLASLNNHKIREINFSLPDNRNKLLVIVNKTIYESGINMQETDMKIFIQIATQEIIDDYKHLSIEDVRIAFKNGVRKKYGDYFGLNIATISVWLTTYINTTKTNAMQRLALIKKNEPVVELTEMEKKKQQQSWLENIYSNFDKFKKTGVYDFIDFKNGFYNHCKALKLIKLSEQEQQEIWDIAVNELKREYHPMNAHSYGQKIDFAAVLEKLMTRNENKSTNELIISKARKIAVKRLFESLVMEGKELKDFIEKTK